MTKFETLQTRTPAADIELSDSQLFLDYNAHVAMTKTITKAMTKAMTQTLTKVMIDIMSFAELCLDE